MSEKEELPPNQRIQSKMNDGTKENPITWRDTWKPWTLRSGHCTEDCPVRKPQPSRDGVDGRTIPITWRDTGRGRELRLGYCTESCPVAASIRKKEREKQERKRIENREKRANLGAVRDKIKVIGAKAEKAVSGFKMKKKKQTKKKQKNQQKKVQVNQRLQNRNNWLVQHKWSTNHMKRVAAGTKNRKNIETVEYRPNGTSYKAKVVSVGGRRRKSRKNLKKNSGKGGKRRKTRRKRKRKKRRTKRR